MDLFSLFLLTHENNEIKSPTKINDFTVSKSKFKVMGICWGVWGCYIYCLALVTSHDI